MYTVNAAALVLSNIIAYYILQDANKLNNEDGEGKSLSSIRLLHKYLQHKKFLRTSKTLTKHHLSSHWLRTSITL